MRMRFVSLVLFWVVAFSYGLVADILFEIDQNDGVALRALFIGEGEPTRFLEEGPYSASLLDSSGNAVSSRNFPVTFALLGEPPTPLETVPVAVRLPYAEGARKLEIRHGSAIIFSRELPGPYECNSNGVCDARETSVTCPSDCSVENADGYCAGLSEGICDPDCGNGLDADCVPSAPEAPAAQACLPALMVMTLCASCGLAGRA
ncbi:MAG: hypothetical protein AB1657_01120 [Candidatus Micrarchaeota archaeon]